VEYVFDTALPEDAIVVDEYNGHNFTNYYYHDGVFWFCTGVTYRRLHINIHAQNGVSFVIMYDDNGVKRQISIASYRRMIGEII
jgi:hypothetical protein